jgi:protein TonB
VSQEALARKGMRFAWAKEVHLVDGETLPAPKLLHRVDPLYPKEAKAAQQEGSVVLRVLIGRDGAVEEVEVVRGQPHGLNEAATAAARQWRFTPALLSGKAVPVLLTLTINFRLDDDEKTRGAGA